MSIIGSSLLFTDISVIHEEPTKQVDPDVSDTTKGQDVAITYSYNKDEEVKIVDNSNDTSDKCKAHNEKDEKVETTDNTNKNWFLKGLLEREHSCKH